MYVEIIIFKTLLLSGRFERVINENRDYFKYIAASTDKLQTINLRRFVHI